MAKFLRKAWPHLLILGAVVVFVILSPHIYDRYFVQDGDSIANNVELPAETTAAQFSLEPLGVYSDQGVFQVSGWAFLTLDKNIPTSSYTRQIVLSSETGNYIFQSEILQRIDIYTRFNHVGMDLLMSGFKTLIYKNAIKPGVYSIGIIFSSALDNSAYYVSLDKCIHRTHNRFWMEGLESAACRAVLRNEGNPIEINISIPNETIEATFSFEGMKLLDEGVYQLSGWAFPTVDRDIPSSNYERQVILISETGNYVFLAKATTRLDVQEYFSNLGMDVTKSGLFALISPNSLASGSYNVGLIFKNISNGTAYFVNTGRCITKKGEELAFENPGATVCQYLSQATVGRPIQKNVTLLFETNQAKFAFSGLSVYNEQGIYQLSGWAFPMVDKSIPSGDYKRQVVLVSKTGNYVFSAETTARTDVQEYFRDLGMDLNQSGLSALIAIDSVEPDSYNLILIFKHISNGTAYFVNTNRCVTRTNDRLVLEESGSTTCSNQPVLRVGLPTQQNVALPTEITEAKFWIEKLVLKGQNGVYQLEGWAFPVVDKSIPSGNYKRQVVLISKTGNYVFPSETITRTDVQEYFKDLGMNLTESGFSTLIAMDALASGSYNLGLIFEHISNDTAYFVNTSRCLTRTSDKLVLEDPGSTTCTLSLP